MGGFLAVILLSMTACTGQRPQSGYIQTIDSLQKQLIKVEAAYDSLTAAVRFKETNWGDGPTIQFHQLEKQGIKKPVDFIKKSLRSNPHLIPLNPVLGGKMHFTNMQVLTDRWVMATYEDGHIMGRTIFLYSLGPEKELHFRVLISDSAGQ